MRRIIGRMKRTDPPVGSRHARVSGSTLSRLEAMVSLGRPRPIRVGQFDTALGLKAGDLQVYS